MLEVEIDVFSGMPNPRFVLSEAEEQELLNRIMADPGQMSPLMHPTEILGLGYAGVIVRHIKTDTGKWSVTERPNDLAIAPELAAPPRRFPTEFRLGTRTAREESTADWLLKIAERRNLGIADTVWAAIRRGARLLPLPAVDVPRPPEFSPYTPGAAAAAPRGADWFACSSALYTANHEAFNQPQWVALNNCYCFASNHLANSRYALPGRYRGHPAPMPVNCTNIITGLRVDGWVDGCQVNTLTIALVIWPNVDYHFYRLVSADPDWWWEHKRGATPAKWTDESGRPLHNGLSPINCDRVDYIDFCGYFYQNSATAFVA
jgi:hypothetical protein